MLGREESPKKKNFWFSYVVFVSSDIVSFVVCLFVCFYRFCFVVVVVVAVVVVVVVVVDCYSEEIFVITFEMETKQQYLPSNDLRRQSTKTSTERLLDLTIFAIALTTVSRI